MAKLATFRDQLLQIVPWWLRGSIASRILWAIGVVIEIVADQIVSGVRRRFPGYDSGDSLPIIGRERRIRRGPNEPDEVYALRLRRWLTDHAHRGGPYALLSQVGAFYSQNPFPITLVYTSGRRFERDVDGSVVMADGPTFGGLGSWAHWWLIYSWPIAIAPDGNWDDPDGDLWDDGTGTLNPFTWDTNLLAATVREMRLVPSEWNAAHAIGHIIVLGPSSTIWDFPIELWSDPGTWDATPSLAVTVQVDD